MKKRQETMAGRLEAGAELQALQSGSSLDQALLEAGIGGGRSSSDDIFAEITRSEAPKTLAQDRPTPGIAYDPKP